MPKLRKNFTNKQLRERAWKLISSYVRRNARIGDTEFVRCFTCLAVVHWKQAHCGHYIHNKLDFDLDNLKPQCIQCNYFKSGKLDKYAERLIREKGQDWVDQLRARAQIKGNFYTRQEIEAIIKKYK